MSVSNTKNAVYIRGRKLRTAHRAEVGRMWYIHAQRARAFIAYATFLEQNYMCACAGADPGLGRLLPKVRDLCRLRFTAICSHRSGGRP